MDILTKDINKFVVQKGIVKNSVVNEIFEEKSIIKINDVELIYEDDILICICKDVAYLCKWKDDLTIIMYRHEEKCKVCFIDGEKKIKTFYIHTGESLSVFTLMMDYYELENILNFNCLYHPRLCIFLF